VRDTEVWKVQVLDVLYQLETRESWCSWTVKERISLMWYREERQLTQMHTSAPRKKWRSISNKFGLTRSCMKCYFSVITQGLICVRTLEAITQMDGWCYRIHPTAPA
jgi:hypothetical protein